ncbi:MAG: hypothetical protein IJJ99_10165 [Oscillospiraceae bacterium]|nr:hypothetical protein [Oscillospiraceae bacterium]
MDSEKKARTAATDEIVRLFFCDTITMLDLVLSENIEQPEHSANTVWSRLELAAEYDAEQNGTTVTVPALLQKSGYPQEAIDRLTAMCQREKERHKELCEEQNCSTSRYEKATPGW